MARMTMKRFVLLTIGTLSIVGLIDSVQSTADAKPYPRDYPAYSLSCLRNLDETLTPSELVGKYIWFCATAGNARFFTYTYPQRLGILIDWYGVLRTDDRDSRFSTWGLINDPDCCRPGDKNCPAKSYEETYGFDWCPGDENLLPFVGKIGKDGKSGYRDPACQLEDAPLPEKDPHGPNDLRQNACDLEFGTSTGALGFRKFPNPRFNKERWKALNGRLGTWSGFQKKLDDASIEPPFLVGMACGACHIAFDPLTPPKNPAHPTWKNISGTVGNQYGRVSQIFASGMKKLKPHSLEWQVFAYARPGVVDTSAIPNDFIVNPGTANAIINTPIRLHTLTFNEKVTKWRKVNRCLDQTDEQVCWCEPGKPGKCWKRGTKHEPVNHVLKGGEDSIGILEALQRVYINIGSCGEEAWVNHLTDPYQFDPHQRNYGQTPFKIGQARRDCAQFRAIEDRLPDLANFLLTAGPTDLYKARGMADEEDLREQLEEEFGNDSVDRGRDLFKNMCAQCHSSQQIPEQAYQFRELSTEPDTKGIRMDWLGNEKLILASEVGTNWSRALHTNHMTGHIWEEFASETLRAKAPDPNLPNPSDGGRGYYRNISLLSVWAHAPFMHNNAIGPELCGVPGKQGEKWKDALYRSPYVNLENPEKPVAIADPPNCWKFDPSVEGRYKLFKASMDALLNPKNRPDKVTLLDEEVRINVGPKLRLGQNEKHFVGATIIFPEGMPAARLGNFRHKAFVNDLVKTFKGDMKWPPLVNFAKALRAEAQKAKNERGAINMRDVIKSLTQEHRQAFRKRYQNSSALKENQGHRFGEDLSEQGKKDLTAFLATL